MSNHASGIPRAAAEALFLFLTSIILPVVLFGHVSAVLAA